MEFIAHRINTIAALKTIPSQFGVELDIRDQGRRLVLEHDPFKKGGEDFAEYLKHYRHGTLILNIKSERIENEVLRLLRKHRIKKYFFLDSSFPMIHYLIKNGEKNIALRFSEFEKMDTILTMKGKVKWVWVDCFRRLPINRRNYRILKKAEFKLCLVSPELQGRPSDIEKYKAYLKMEKIVIDAICTKYANIPIWNG